MKSLFIDKKAKIKVVIFTAKDKDDNIFLSNQEETLKENKDMKDETIEKHEIIFKHPNYGDSVDIYRNSVKVENGGLKIDPISLRFNKLVNLIEDWDFKDEKGKKIVVNNQNVMNLHPEMANLIIDELEREIGSF